MANTQTLVPVADPNALVAGQILDDKGAWENLAAEQNYLLGSGLCHPQYHAMMPDGVAGGWFQHTGAAQSVFASAIRLPVLSDRHLSMREWVRCSTNAGGNTTFTYTTGAGASAFNVAAGTALGDQNLGLATLAAGTTDDTTLTVATAGGTTATVYGFRMVPEALASPLPAQSIGGGGPLGVTQFTADRAASALHNRRIIQNAEEIRDRLRVLWCWAGLDPALGDDHMRDHLHMTHALAWPGARDHDVEYTASVDVDNAGNPARTVYLLVGDRRGWPTRSLPIPVGAGFTGRLADFTFRIPEDAWVSGFPWAYCPIGIWPGTAGGGRTNTNVRQITVWGA